MACNPDCLECLRRRIADLERENERLKSELLAAVTHDAEEPILVVTPLFEGNGV